MIKIKNESTFVFLEFRTNSKKICTSQTSPDFVEWGLPLIEADSQAQGSLSPE